MSPERLTCVSKVGSLVPWALLNLLMTQIHFLQVPEISLKGRIPTSPRPSAGPTAAQIL